MKLFLFWGGGGGGCGDDSGCSWIFYEEAQNIYIQSSFHHL